MNSRRARATQVRLKSMRQRIHTTWKYYRWSWRLCEIEIRSQIAELRRVLTDIGPRIRTPVRLRIDARAVQEVVLDEFHVRVEAQGLMIDVALPRVRADDKTGHAQSVPHLIDLRRHD